MKIENEIIMNRRIFLIISIVFSALAATAQSAFTLAQLQDSALQHNIAIRNARNGIAAAEEQRKEAFTKYFANISGTGAWFNANKGMAKMDMNPSEMLPESLLPVMAQSLPAEMLASLNSPISMTMMKNGTIAGVNAIQPVFAGGQIVNGNKLAKVAEEASHLQLHLSENEVEKTTAQYYWQLVSLQEKMKTIAAVEALLNDIHKDVDVAVRAGVAMRNDLLQVQLRQNDVESQRLKLRNGISLMKLLMAQYCGLRDTSFSIAPVADYSEQLPPSPLTETDKQNSLMRLSEYQLLGKQVDAAALQKKMAIGQNLPSLAVGAGYNYHNMLGNDRTFAMVFATVSVPISDWWGGSHAVKRKKIEYQQAVDEQNDKAEMLKIRMQKAWNDVSEACLQLSIARRSIEQAEENLRLNRNQYQAGISKMSDLLEAQLLYQQALDRRTDAYADYQNRLLEYRQTVGM